MKYDHSSSWNKLNNNTNERNIKTSTAFYPKSNATSRLIKSSIGNRHWSDKSGNSLVINRLWAIGKQDSMNSNKSWNWSDHNNRAHMFRKQQQYKAGHKCKRFLEKGNKPIIMSYDDQSQWSISKIHAFIPRTQASNNSQFSNLFSSSPESDFNDKVLGTGVIANSNKVNTKTKKTTKFSKEMYELMLIWSVMIFLRKFSLNKMYIMKNWE